MKGISNTCKYIREMCSGILLCNKEQNTIPSMVNV